MDPIEQKKHMPELPEVETVRRGLAAVMVGRPIVDVLVRRGDLRRPLPEGFAAALTGRTVSPGIFDVLFLLGKEESLERLTAAGHAAAG